MREIIQRIFFNYILEILRNKWFKSGIRVKYNFQLSAEIIREYKWCKPTEISKQ